MEQAGDWRKGTMSKQQYRPLGPSEWVQSKLGDVIETNQGWKPVETWHDGTQAGAWRHRFSRPVQAQGEQPVPVPPIPNLTQISSKLVNGQSEAEKPTQTGGTAAGQVFCAKGTCKRSELERQLQEAQRSVADWKDDYATCKKMLVRTTDERDRLAEANESLRLEMRTVAAQQIGANVGEVERERDRLAGELAAVARLVTGSDEAVSVDRLLALVNALKVRTEQACNNAESAQDERDRLAGELEKERAYIQQMDAVIDDARVARSCINPLKDLQIAVGNLVVERDRLQRELELVRGELANAQTANSVIHKFSQTEIDRLKAECQRKDEALRGARETLSQLVSLANINSETRRMLAEIGNHMNAALAGGKDLQRGVEGSPANAASEAVCGLCGLPQHRHSQYDDNSEDLYACPIGASGWHPTNRFTPAEKGAA
jgi:hypothetical protein